MKQFSENSENCGGDMSESSGDSFSFSENPTENSLYMLFLFLIEYFCLVFRVGCRTTSKTKKCRDMYDCKRN